MAWTQIDAWTRKDSEGHHSKETPWMDEPIAQRTRRSSKPQRRLRRSPSPRSHNCIQSRKVRWTFESVVETVAPHTARKLVSPVIPQIVCGSPRSHNCPPVGLEPGSSGSHGKPRVPCLTEYFGCEINKYVG
jgi:hypothetical protein